MRSTKGTDVDKGVERTAKYNHGCLSGDWEREPPRNFKSQTYKYLYFQNTPNTHSRYKATKHIKHNKKTLQTLQTLQTMSTIGFAFKRFWQSETGPRTVHFWAPTLKWGLVFAGLSDLNRPVDKLSGTQNLSLLATALIWTRWSFVIKPKNYLLASVNFFLGCTAGVQIGRLMNYRLTNGDTMSQAIGYLFHGKPANTIASSGNGKKPEQLIA